MVSIKAFAGLAVIAVAAGCSTERHLLGAQEGDEDAGSEDVAPDGARDSGADAPYLTVAELWQQFVVITCDQMQKCCTPEEKFKNALAADREFCRSKITNNRAGLAEMLALSIVASV